MRIMSLLATASLALSTFAFAEQVVTFTNKEEAGKKVWVASTNSVKAGEDVKVTLINTLTAVHGFEIPGLTEAVPVAAGETKVITIKAPKAGEYTFRCHMHPPHVGGKFEVK